MDGSDLLRILVSMILIVAVMLGMRAMGWSKPRTEGKRFQWDWGLFGAVFVVILILNLVWPDR